MNFKTMSSIAIGKRVVGWIIFIFSLISTLISLISLAGIKGIQGEGINAVLNDFIKVMAEMARQSSPF